MLQSTLDPDPLADVKAKVFTLLKEGLSYSKIVQATGCNLNTLKTWAKRNHLQPVRPVSSKPQPKPDQTAGLSQIVRGRLGKELVKATNQIDKLNEPKSAKDMALRAKLVKDIAEPASLVFGWGEGKTVTNLLSIQSYTTGQIQDQDQVQALDIESEPVIDPAIVQNQALPSPDLSPDPAQP
jgi:hypothetical protein